MTLNTNQAALQADLGATVTALQASQAQLQSAKAALVALGETHISGKMQDALDAMAGPVAVLVDEFATGESFASV